MQKFKSERDFGQWDFGGGLCVGFDAKGRSRGWENLVLGVSFAVHS